MHTHLVHVFIPFCPGSFNHFFPSMKGTRVFYCLFFPRDDFFATTQVRDSFSQILSLFTGDPGFQGPLYDSIILQTIFHTLLVYFIKA